MDFLLLVFVKLAAELYQLQSWSAPGTRYGWHGCTTYINYSACIPGTVPGANSYQVPGANS